jgi:hypothetical protein
MVIYQTAIRGLQSRQAIHAVLIAPLLCAGTAWAGGDGCKPYDILTHQNATVTDCDLQKQTPIKYGALDTKGWAYYCRGDHPYAWNYKNGYIFAYSFDNSCFSITENIGSEGDASKFDFTITNWCLKSESFTISLACSDVAPPDSLARAKATSDGAAASSAPERRR